MISGHRCSGSGGRAPRPGQVPDRSPALRCCASVREAAGPGRGRWGAGTGSPPGIRILSPAPAARRAPAPRPPPPPPRPLPSPSPRSPLASLGRAASSVGLTLPGPVTHQGPPPGGRCGWGWGQDACVPGPAGAGRSARCNASPGAVRVSVRHGWRLSLRLHGWKRKGLPSQHPHCPLKRRRGFRAPLPGRGYKLGLIGT